MTNTTRPAEEGGGNLPSPSGYWWSPKTTSAISPDLACWSSNTGPHPDWEVTAFYSAEAVRRILAATGAAAAGHDAERMDRIRKAINGYHLALDTRQHGGVAMDRAFNIIADAMGMPWVPGAAARAAQAQGGA